MRKLKPLLQFWLVMVLVGGFSGIPAAFAQNTCTRPAGVVDNPLATPGTTAAQAAAGGNSLAEFSLAARDYFNSIISSEELGYSGCLIRNEGPWKSGSTYIVALTLDGRVLLHSENMSFGGRKLQPELYASILFALGITGTTQAEFEIALGQVAATRTFPNADGGHVPVVGGYAVGYGTSIPYILLAGLDLQESHFAPETLDPGNPPVRADEVVDRSTLKLFVNGAIDYLLELYQTNPIEAPGIVRSILRRPPWRHGPVYLFVMDPTGFVHLHGGFPDRFEFQIPTDTLRDEVTGELILPQIIKVATEGGDEGGFVRYFFDNPDDDTDSADVPKVTYARLVTQTIEIPGFGPITSSFIVGAGIYGDTVSAENVEAIKGWLARFGRAVGSQAVEMISGRMNSPAPSEGEMILGGQTVNLSDVSTRSLPWDDAGSDFYSIEDNGIVSGGLARAWAANQLTLGNEGNYTGLNREMTLSRLLSGSSFHLASPRGATGAASSRWSIWGRGSRTGFEGGGDAAIDGDVTMAMLGMDFEKGQLLSGLALSRANGEGGFESTVRNDLEATLTSVHPYLRYTMNEQFSIWSILGFGQGEMTFYDNENDNEIETDIDMQMGAFGIRGALSRMGVFDLAVKSDILVTQVDSDEKDGLEAISAETSRLRVMLEASRDVVTEGGRIFRPSIEAGLRRDGGDVDEGMGLELGGSLRFTDPDMGLTLELKARGLITHEEEDVADWGVGGLIRIARGKAGRGLALTVQPSVGETADGAARLWTLEDASLLTRKEMEDLAPRMRTEVGYGMDTWNGLLTPYAGFSVSKGGYGTYRIGSRFTMGESLSTSVEGAVRERVNADPVHALFIHGSLRW